MSDLLNIERCSLLHSLYGKHSLSSLYGNRTFITFMSSDNSIYRLINNSKNKSRMFWLGLTFNFNSFKPVQGKQQNESDDRSMIRLGN